MIWVTWRQFRTTILAAVGAVLALAVVAAVCGFVIRSAERQVAFGTAFGCPKTGTGAAECWSESTLTLATLITVGLPALLGVLVGVTVFSRDVERGTHVLGLSQSVSRRRWYWSRILVVFVPVTIAMTVLGFTLEWTRAGAAPSDYAFVSRSWYGFSQLTFPLFQATGLVAGAYTLVALLLGSLVGFLIRNMLGAMAVTLIAMTALTIGFQVLARPHYATPVVDARPLGSDYWAQTASIDRAWVLGWGYVDTEGRTADFSGMTCDQFNTAYAWHERPDETRAEYEARLDAIYADQRRAQVECQRSQGIDHFEIRSHPDTRFRRFQLTEVALLLVLAGILLVPSLWAVRRLRP